MNAEPYTQFHQVIRAATPLFIIILSSVLFDAIISRDRVYALLPVMLGVALA
jgi:hypothetical protein